MKVTIQPSQLKGRAAAPASKSSMQRACAAALLRKGRTDIYNAGHSNDDKAALRIIEALGARVERNDYRIRVFGNGTVSPVEKNGLAEINCGESGLSIRMFTPIVALSDKKVIITGEGSLTSRPMDFFDNVLPELGVKIQSQHGRLPLTVQGPLLPRNIEIDGSLSSQFLTGLLMAYAGADARNVLIKVNNLKSKPYVDMTLLTLHSFGLKQPVNTSEGFWFAADEHRQDRDAMEFTVEGDWSGGAFLLVAGAVAGPVSVRGLNLLSAQADKKIVDALMLAGAAVAIEAKGIVVHPAEMNGFIFDATDSPDLFPPLVALAAYCRGETRIKGVSRLAHKESNRALTLQEEFGKMGVRIEYAEDSMTIYGGRGVRGAHVHSRHDHRIAMACAVAALKAEGETTIEEAQAVSKSYPDFYRDLQLLNASLSLPYQLIQ